MASRFMRAILEHASDDRPLSDTSSWDNATNEDAFGSQNTAEVKAAQQAQTGNSDGDIQEQPKDDSSNIDEDDDPFMAASSSKPRYGKLEEDTPEKIPRQNSDSQGTEEVDFFQADNHGNIIEEDEDPPETMQTNTMDEEGLPSLREEDDDDGMAREAAQLPAREKVVSQELEQVSSRGSPPSSSQSTKRSLSNSPNENRSHGSSSNRDKIGRVRQEQAKKNKHEFDSADEDDYPISAKFDKRALKDEDPHFADPDFADDRTRGSRESFEGPILDQVIKYDEGALNPAQGDEVDDDDASFSRTDVLLGGKKGEGLNVKKSTPAETSLPAANAKSKEDVQAESSSPPMGDSEDVSRSSSRKSGKKEKHEGTESTGKKKKSKHSKKKKDKKEKRSKTTSTLEHSDVASSVEYSNSKEDDVSTLGDPMNIANQHPQYRPPPAESNQVDEEEAPQEKLESVPESKAVDTSANPSNPQNEKTRKKSTSKKSRADRSISSRSSKRSKSSRKGRVVATAAASGAVDTHSDYESNATSEIDATSYATDPFLTKKQRYNEEGEFIKDEDKGSDDGVNYTNYRNVVADPMSAGGSSKGSEEESEGETSFTELFQVQTKNNENDLNEYEPENAKKGAYNFEGMDAEQPRTLGSLGSDEDEFEDEQEKQEEERRKKRRRTILLLVCLGCVLICLGALAGGIVGVTALDDDEDPRVQALDEESTSAAPSTSPSNETDIVITPPTSGPTVAPIITDLDLFELIAGASSDDGAAIRVPGTPQQEAFKWLQNEDTILRSTSRRTKLRALQDRKLNSISDERIIQRYALACFFFSTLGPTDWLRKDKWLSVEDSECDWQIDSAKGMDCVDDVVTRLEFQGNRVVGELPKEIGMLTGLEVLEIDNLGTDDGTIAMRGGIPSDASELTNLTILKIGGNDFTEALPDDIFANWPSITSIDLSSNSMPGPIPSSVSQLSGVAFFNLGNNRLTGTLPEEISGFSVIVFLDVRNNNLSGPLPAALSSLTQLIGLYLNDNQFTGGFPDIAQLSQLRSGFDLSNNQLSGEIAQDAFAGNTKLRVLRLSNNNFSGSLPDLSYFSANIKDVYLEGNNFSGGEVPLDVCTSVALRDGVAAIDCGGPVTCVCCGC